MVGASKILTVSYGTFSCTLEGFEEPFGTMKAIAEYFRDLAADDRYFGAEPPIPDAAMLHRIAEREIHRRVEAKIQDNSVILRAGDIAPTMPRPAPTDTAPPEPRPTPRAPTGLVADESVAARLSRIRNAAATQVAPTLRLVEDAVFTEDQHADAPAARAAPAASAPITHSEPAVSSAQAAATAPTAAEDVAQAAAQSPAAESEINETEPAAPALSDAGPVALAAAAPPPQEPDLREAVVSPAASADLAAPQDMAMAAPGEAADEDEETEPLLLEPAAADDAGMGDAVLILSAPVDAEPAAADTDDAMVPDIRAFMDSLMGDAPAAEAAPVPEPSDVLPEDSFASASAPDDDLLPEMIGDDSDAAAEAALMAALAAPVAEVDEDTVEVPDNYIGALIATLSGSDNADVVGGDPAIAAESDIWDVASEPAASDANAPGDGAIATLWPADPADPADPAAPVQTGTDVPLADRLRRARARVIKVRRPDLPPTTPTPTALSAEAEAELLRELAEVERETDPHHREGLTVLEANANNDESVNRLLRQTNSEMNGLDTRRRVSTIAHLKAAVAATVADQKNPTAASGSEPSRLDSYRADLARVVRPRRPGDAPSADRPAPLVLVSEQRVDRPKPLQLAPQSQPDATGARVLPRRVTSSNLAVEPRHDDDADAEDPADAPRIAPMASGSFADFAEKLGATDLADLLEAAAAYTVCVEGRPYFSRPQVLRHVSEMSSDDMTREDGLRSFGQLLRQGKIAKVKRGHFEITATSRYLAEAQRLAN